MICEELLDLQKASADDMQKSVYDNYTVFIRSLLTFLLPTELAAIFEVALVVFKPEQNQSLNLRIGLLWYQELFHFRTSLKRSIKLKRIEAQNFQNMAPSL